MNSKIFTLFVVLTVQHHVLGKSCENLNGFAGCACRDSETDKIVSLEALVLNDTQKRVPRFETQSAARWRFAYHPCGLFDMFLNIINPNPGYYGCKQTTAARYTEGSVRQCQGLGDFTDAKFSYDKNFTYPVTSDFTVTYRNKTATDRHGAVISLICSENMLMNETTFNYVNFTEDVQETYYFTLTSPCACPGGCHQYTPEQTTTTASTTTVANATTTQSSNATTTQSSTTPSSGRSMFPDFKAFMILFIFAVKLLYG